MSSTSSTEPTGDVSGATHDPAAAARRATRAEPQDAPDPAAAVRRDAVPPDATLDAAGLDRPRPEGAGRDSAGLDSAGLDDRDRHAADPGEADLDGVGVGGRTPTGDEQASPVQSTGRARIPLLEAVQGHPLATGLIAMADEFLAGQGFTEHGFRHANLVGHIAYNVLTHLGFDERTAELGAVSGYLHDIGNVVSRANHGQSSGLIAMTILRELDVPIRDIAQVMGAAGNHEEAYGVAVSPISAAVIVADKSDVHRSRVRDTGDIEHDIHDRVNFAVTSSFLRVAPRSSDLSEQDTALVESNTQGGSGKVLVRPDDADVRRTLTLELEVDTDVTPVFEYFEIFMERMVMCRRAGRTLGAEFRITVNDVAVL